jgi:hypothetical protein
MRGRCISLMLAVFIACGLTLEPSWPALADIGDIAVGGVWICRITHAASGYSPAQRAVEVNRRITEVLSTPRFRLGAVVSVRPAGGSAVILVGDKLVFTVAPEDVAGTTITPIQQARLWARLLAQGLSKALPDANFHTF